jgi:hypothetical protein
VTATELQSRVRILANQCYVRYWLNWPSQAEPKKRFMAISLAEVDDRDRVYFVESADLEREGFAKTLYRGGPLYVIERTEE